MGKGGWRTGGGAEGGGGSQRSCDLALRTVAVPRVAPGGQGDRALYLIDVDGLASNASGRSASNRGALGVAAWRGTTLISRTRTGHDADAATRRSRRDDRAATDLRNAPACRRGVACSPTAGGAHDVGAWRRSALSRPREACAGGEGLPSGDARRGAPPAAAASRRSCRSCRPAPWPRSDRARPPGLSREEARPGGTQDVTGGQLQGSCRAGAGEGRASPRTDWGRRLGRRPKAGHMTHHVARSHHRNGASRPQCPRQRPPP